MTDAGEGTAGSDGTPPEDSTSDDTGAFQRFYQEADPPARGPLYRIFVGWWKDRPAAR